MLAKKYYHYKQDCDQEGILFSFSGFISEGILFALGEVLKQKVELETSDPGKVKKVFSVFVELVQNIIRYSADGYHEIASATDRLGSGIINVGTQGEHFYVGCGNIIPTEGATSLKEQLTTLQNLDKDKLRQYYRHRLKEGGEINGCQGACLGLIEIARRSSEPIEFDFIEIDADKSFYYIKTYI